MTKKELKNILNIYQNYYNDFKNISDDDLNQIYLMVANSDLSIKQIKKEVNKLINNLNK
jgi:hypothetical protein